MKKMKEEEEDEFLAEEEFQAQLKKLAEGEPEKGV